MKIGIFFGGQSREREVSFAGGRTVYDNLNKSLFEPIPIFVDSLGNFIHLDWQYIYKGTIRDFYPPSPNPSPLERGVSHISPPLGELEGASGDGGRHKFQIYVESLGKLTDSQLDNVINKVGKRISPEQFKDLFDFAFLALHGTYGEDGNIQGLLEWYGIPYSGSGILPSAIGVNKITQSEILKNAGFYRPKQRFLSKTEWLGNEVVAKEGFPNEITKKLLLLSTWTHLFNRAQAIFEEVQQTHNLPLVIKSPNQGSSIGVTILKEDDFDKFFDSINKSFFLQNVRIEEWQQMSPEAKEKFIVHFTDIRDSLGFPVWLLGYGSSGLLEDKLIYLPQELLNTLNEIADNYAQNPIHTVYLQAENSEEFIIIEEYIAGKEFSCIVIQGEGEELIALPPTEIRKFNDVFDYRSKYLPGTSRKITPIEVEPEIIEKIRQECCRLFKALHCNVYARIDGFITLDNQVYLNDPNTTSGMLPSSFFFHQSAEIGLDAKNFLTYIIRTSLAERIKTGKQNQALRQLLRDLDDKITHAHNQTTQKTRVAVIMGGYSSERHISMESGRNIYEKLASSTEYAPFPVFLTGDDNHHELYILPVNYMMKDNADDIRDKIYNTLNHNSPSLLERAWGEAELSTDVIQQITINAQAITQRYAGKPLMKPHKIDYQILAEKVDVVFIALHGRPGEDGAVQKELEKYHIPYNGSGVASSQITINKYETNEILQKNGILVAHHTLVYQNDWEANPDKIINLIEKEFTYPLIAKPADDGCSSAVKKLKNREQFIAFANLMFRPEEEFLPKEAQVLQLKRNEEFPKKNYFLVEELIAKKNAHYFLEITGGMLTSLSPQSTDNRQWAIQYEIFEPSEALATGDVLSLEEKFLAGEGQNITPAVYTSNSIDNQLISEKVRAELEKVARILNVEGYCRIDAFVRVYENSEVEVVIIEVNSLPGMTPATCIFHQAALNHYKPFNFIDGILKFALEKKKINSQIVN